MVCVAARPAPHFLTHSKAGVQGAGDPCHHGGMPPCVSILANQRNGTLYVGATSDLSRRATQHRTAVIDRFTKRYGVHSLVYVVFHSTMAEAILRESASRNGGEPGNSALIEEDNPTWRDLYDEIL